MADSAGAGRRLLLLRHGRTAWNAEQRAQGHSDVDLDDVGRAQAAEVAPYVASLGPVSLWSSDLARARSTAEVVAKETGLVLQTDPRLREYDLGRRTGMTMPDYAAAFPDEYAAFRTGRYDVVPEGETTPQVTARVLTCLGEILATLDPGEGALVVGHGAALKVALASLLGWPEGAAASLRGLDNCALAVVEETAFGGTLRLTSYNLRAPWV